jgi:hypothetical protein
MKKLFLILGICLILCGCKQFNPEPAFAEGESKPVTITAKEGFVMTWDNPVMKNLVTFETVRTKEVDSWGQWNALTAGWSIDAGFAFDAKTINTGALLIGRQFGTLADYLPFLDYPLLNKISITIYPVGLYIENLTDHPKFKGCSGGAIIKAEIKFG